MEGTSLRNASICLNVPRENQKPGNPDKVALPDLFLATATGNFTSCEGLFQGNGPERRVHPNVVEQLSQALEPYKVNPRDNINQLLVVGAAPYYWTTPTEQRNRAMSIPVPPQEAGPGIDLVFPLRCPYSATQLYTLAPLFWRNWPKGERSVVCSLSLAEQGEYYQRIWEFEGINGLERISTKVDSDYNHKWVWTQIIKRRWRSVEQAAQLIKLCTSQPKSLWLANQVGILQPLVQETFRKWFRLLELRSPFDKNNGARETCKDRASFPDYSQCPLPAAQSPLEQLPHDLFAQVFHRLRFDDIRALQSTSRRLNGLIGGVSDSHKSLWQPVLQYHHPELLGINLPPSHTFHFLAQEERKVEWLQQLLIYCSRDDLANSNLLEARFEDCLHIGMARAWDGSNQPPQVLIERAGRVCRIQNCPSIAIEGALLQPGARHQWWVIIGKVLSPKLIPEIVSDMDRRYCPSFFRGFYERTEKPKLTLASLKTLRLDQEESAGLMLLMYPRLDIFESGFDDIQGRLKTWLREEAENGTPKPTRAMQAMVEALSQFLGHPPIESSDWKDFFSKTLIPTNDVIKAFRKEMLEALKQLLPNNDLFRQIAK